MQGDAEDPRIKEFTDRLIMEDIAIYNNPENQYNRAWQKIYDLFYRINRLEEKYDKKIEKNYNMIIKSIDKYKELERKMFEICEHFDLKLELIEKENK